VAISARLTNMPKFISVAINPAMASKLTAVFRYALEL